jgi:PEP-CTERM motif
MILRKLTFFIFPILLFGFLSESSAVTVYNESGSGDLSGSGTTPTIVTVSAGSNDIFGSTGRDDSGVVDRDYFTINVPAGLGLRSIIVLPGTAGGPPMLISFIGIQAGSQVTVPTNAANAAGLLGFYLYGATDINTDILPATGTAGNSSDGFVPPLGAGNYAFWIQEGATGSFPYGFSLVVAKVPEPTALAMILSGLAVFGTMRRCRKN